MTDISTDQRRAPLFVRGQPSADPSGRPRKKLPRHGLTLVESLAANGVRESDIALACGMSRSTFTQRKRDNDAIRDALARGRAASKLARARPGQSQGGLNHGS
jgi:hypothetical protein